METEIPALLRAHGDAFGRDFTFHSSRMRMQKVTAEQLREMDRDSHRCAAELADARVDVMGYACLVAIMSMGLGYHRKSEEALSKIAAAEGGAAPIVSSAGALVETIRSFGWRRISIVTPYMRPLTDTVVHYIENEGIAVQDSIALEIPDNLDVARRDPARLLNDIDALDISGVEAVVLSACVQMQSLPSLEAAQDKLGLPVTSAAACTVRTMLLNLGLEAKAQGGGAVLA